MERTLLESVVRLEVRARDLHGEWGAQISHGTILGGRYLVTHNHFGLQLSTLEPSAASDGASVSLYRADGERIWPEGGAIRFVVVAANAATLVLDFGMTDPGRGFFESRGLKSASIWSNGALRFEPGAEVAKVDWADGKAYLEWAQVEAIRDEAGTAILVLSGDTQPGASGGGVFWRGQHVANNWASVEVLDGNGNLMGAYSKAALNSQGIMPSLGEPTPE